MRHRETLLVFCFLIFACLSAVAQESSVKSYENIPYKIVGNGRPVLLDIFLPKTPGVNDSFPVAMIIHGGGWVAGDKSLDSIYYMKKLKAELLDSGFAVISIDYRLAGKDVHLQALVEDCKDAIRWVRGNADKYHLSGNSIGLWGGSAGGHLALLAAYSDDSAWTSDTTLARYSSKVNCVVDNFGPTDLNLLFRTGISKFPLFFARIFFRKLLAIRDPLLYALTGYDIDSNKKEVGAAASCYSPLRYVDTQPVPTFILQGTRDKVVPFKQSALLQKALSEKHVGNRLLRVSKGDHGFNNISRRQIDDLVKQTAAFMKEHEVKSRE